MRFFLLIFTKKITKKPFFKKILLTLRFSLLFFICSFISSCSYSNACYSNLKGVFSFEKGNYSSALLSYKKAANLSPGSKEYIYYNIGRLYSSLGENASSAGVLDSVTELNDKKLEYRINYLKAVIAHNEGRYKDAIFLYKKSVKIDNSDINLLKGLELAFRQLENRKSIEKKTGERISQSPDTDNYLEKKDKNTEEDKTAEIAVSDSVLDLIFTEEVMLCPGSGKVDLENSFDW